MVQPGEISEADTPTIRMGTTPSGLITDPPPSSPTFTPDATPAATLPIYPGLKLLLHPFNGLFSRTTFVSQHQKDKPFWILLEQEMMGSWLLGS